MKIVTEVWPMHRKNESHYYISHANACSFMKSYEKFYFYNCQQTVFQTGWPKWSDFPFVAIVGRQRSYFTPGFLRLFAALLPKAHHQKTAPSCLPSPALNMLSGATLNKGWWNDKKKWSVLNHPPWKWTEMRSTPGWSDTEALLNGFSPSEFTM